MGVRSSHDYEVGGDCKLFDLAVGHIPTDLFLLVRSVGLCQWFGALRQVGSGKVGSGGVRYGAVRCGRCGMEWTGQVRLDSVRQVRFGRSRCGSSGFGRVWQVWYGGVR